VLAGKGKGGGPEKCGKGKSQASTVVPTRAEKDAWVGKSKNNLRWQRRLSAQGGIEDSVFGTGEGAVDLRALEDLFAREAGEEPRLGRGTLAAAERVDKPILWEATEKQDPKKRRTNISILMKTWEKLAEPFLDRLKLLELEGVLCDVSEDSFEQLIDMVKSISSTEWARLREEDAESKYEWDRSIEGFFRRLQAISYFEQRLLGLHRHLVIQRDLRKLDLQVSRLDHGLRVIQQSEAVKVVLQKVLHIGNCLNAGSGNLGRADGFDTVHLLERTLLIDMPKGCDGKTSLLQYIRDRELSPYQREEFAELEKGLQGWKVPSGKEDEADPTDINELQKDSEVISEQLLRLESDLDEAIQRHVVVLDQPPDPERSARQVQSKRHHLEKQLMVLRGYDIDVKKAHRARLEKIDYRLKDMREKLPLLQRYLLYAPPDRKKLSAGKILGVMAQLAQKLAAEKEPLRAGAGRGSSMEPPTSRHGAASTTKQPALRRCASVDSALPSAGTPRQPSNEPSRGRAPKRFAPFLPRRG